MSFDILEDRTCLSAPQLSLSANPLSGRTVELTGFVTDEDPQSSVVTLSGVLSGSVVPDSTGYFSLVGEATALGTVQASVWNQEGLFAYAETTISSTSPSLTMSILYGPQRNITLLGQVTDEDPAGLTVSFTGTFAGSVVTQPDGSFSLEMEPADLGSVFASVDDWWGLSSGATEAVITTDAPGITSFQATKGPNQTWTLHGQVSDEQPDGLTITFSGAVSGSAIISSDGTFSYQTDSAVMGTVSAVVTDWWGVDSAAAEASLTNSDPSVGDDHFSIEENTILTASVAANDTDGDGDTLTFELVAVPASGTVTFASDGSFTYTPNTDFDGTDSFTYMASDGYGGSAIATATITVQQVNQQPSGADDSYSIDEEGLLTVDSTTGVLANDTDPDADGLTAILVTGPVNGTLTLYSDGSFTYIPNPDFNGSDSFTYKANDGTIDGNETTATIAVNPVNDPPTASDDRYSVDEDTMLNIGPAGVLDNDYDPDGDMLSAVLVDNVSSGVLNLNSDGSFSYTASENFHGEDSFTYRANDGSADSNIVTVTITVHSVNDAPESSDDTYQTDEDTQLVVDASGVLGNDSDLDGDSLAAVLVSGPTNGSLSLNSDGSFTYTPNSGFTGEDSFTYQASDGQANSATAIVTIAVSPDQGGGGGDPPSNNPPAASADSYTTDEDTALTIDAPGVLGNDTNPDGHSLFVFDYTQPGQGSVSMGSDGSFTYTPNTDFHGEDSFSYTVEDGHGSQSTATVTITINPINDRPVAGSDSFTTDEDTQLADSVAGNDFDVEQDSLTYFLVSNVANGTLTFNSDGTFSYMPHADFHGTDSFTYYVSDGADASDTATATITVTSVNDIPQAEDDSYQTNQDTELVILASSMLGNDSDPDEDGLFVYSYTQATNGTVTTCSDGSISYMPNPGFSGSDSFFYTVDDGWGGQSSATVHISVDGINAMPTLTLSVMYGAGRTVILCGQVMDEDPAGLTVTFSGAYTGQASTDAGGNFSLETDAAELGSVWATVTDMVGFTSPAAEATIDSAAPALALNVSYGTHRTILLSGQVTDEHAAGLTISISGVVSASVITEADGSFSVELEAFALGLVQAVVSDCWGITSSAAEVMLSSAAPEIHDFTAVKGETTWIFTGRVTDECAEGLVVTFGGAIPVLQGLTAVVAADGWFSLCVVLDEEEGLVSVQAMDWWGQDSHQATTFVLQAG